MKWEYKTISFDKMKFITSSLNTDLFNEKLNSYGDQGWELVSFATTTSLWGHPRAAIAIFKRKSD